MKIVNPAAAFMLLMASALAQQAATKPFEALSTDELASLKLEVRHWCDSPAGQHAIQHGYLPGDSTKAPSADDEELLKRFHAGKLRVAKLAAAQPKAMFSMQTPFALMTPDEFRDQIGRQTARLPNAPIFNTTASSPRKLESTTSDDEIGRQTARFNGSIFDTTTTATIANKDSSSASEHEIDRQTANLPNGSIFRTTTANTSRRHLRQSANPSSVDWVAAGKVTTPRDQGSCHADAVFATIAAVESGYAISRGNALPTLSEQDVLSCGPLQGSCWSAGTNLEDPISWIVNDNGGSVCTANSFPYGAWSGGSVWCGRYQDPAKACVKPDLGVVSYYEDEFEDHVALETLVAQQPVTVLVNSQPEWFQHYTGGLIMGNEKTCPSDDKDLTHAVTIVGYGTSSDGTNFWKVKNSWSQWWGENGYFRIEKGYQGAAFGACGIERVGVTPVFRANQPAADDKRCFPKKAGRKTTGTALKTVLVSSNTACCDICRGQKECVAVNFEDSGNACALLSSITGDEASSGSSTIQLGSSNEVNAQCMPVENNVEYGGNDLMQLMAKTSGDCCDACMRNPGCLAYSWSVWNTGLCSLKTHRGSGINTHPPNADGSPYYVSGEAYKCGKLIENQDIADQDLSNAPAKQAYSCCGICRSTTGCAAFTWSDYNGGTCWLKTGNANAFTKAGSISATAY